MVVGCAYRGRTWAQAWLGWAFGAGAGACAGDGQGFASYLGINILDRLDTKDML